MSKILVIFKDDVLMRRDGKQFVVKDIDHPYQTVRFKCGLRCRLHCLEEYFTNNFEYIQASVKPNSVRGRRMHNEVFGEWIDAPKMTIEEVKSLLFDGH